MKTATEEAGSDRARKIEQIVLRCGDLFEEMGLRPEPGMIRRFLAVQPEAELDRWTGLIRRQGGAS